MEEEHEEEEWPDFEAENDNAKKEADKNQANDEESPEEFVPALELTETIEEEGQEEGEEEREEAALGNPSHDQSTKSFKEAIGDMYKLIAEEEVEVSRIIPSFH